MYPIKLNLTEEEVKKIVAEGEKNPLYKNVIRTYPEFSPLPTIEKLFNNGSIKGYWLRSLQGDIVAGALSPMTDSIRLVNGVAPTAQAVERTVLEYKILFLMQANGIEKGTNYIVYNDAYKSIGITFSIKTPFSVDNVDKGNEFIKNYKELLMEYFEMM